MELKIYYKSIIRNWWMVALAFLLTLAATWLFLNRQTPIYEAQATFVMRPRASIVVEEDLVRAVETLSRRIEINTTYAEIASSKLIRNRAIDNLGLSDVEREGLAVTGRVIAGTNVMEITARGPNAEVLGNFANEVGFQTILYVGDLYDVFELEPLAWLSERLVAWE
jgi:capsular polysaccharide biosynthesis protein